MTLRIAITPGEPAGIGPDLLLELAQQQWPAQLVAIADAKLLQQRAKALGLPLRLTPFDEQAPAQPNEAGELYIHQVDLATPVVAGELDEKMANTCLILCVSPVRKTWMARSMPSSQAQFTKVSLIKRVFLLAGTPSILHNNQIPRMS